MCLGTYFRLPLFLEVCVCLQCEADLWCWFNNNLPNPNQAQLWHVTTRLIQFAAVDSTELVQNFEFPLDGLLSHPFSGSVLVIHNY